MPARSAAVLPDAYDRRRHPITRAVTAVPAAVPGSSGMRLQGRQDVLVVEEHELIQAGLHALLAREPWVGNCHSASSAEIAWQVVLQYRPQIVLISTSLPAPTGFELCHDVVRCIRGARVLLLSSDMEIEHAGALECGAVGVLPKRLPSAVLVAEVRQAAEGDHEPPECDPAPHLSKREFDVLQHLALGLTNSEMALLLNISRWTVKQYTSALYRKLGVRNRTQAARRAQELGIART
ncbi:response regulator transcription factor [Nocardia sp. NPDC004582]